MRSQVSVIKFWIIKLTVVIIFEKKLFVSCNKNNSFLVRSSRDGYGHGWSGGSNAPWYSGWVASTGVSSFFDIALTALAFLSFGIFLLNLLLNALLFTTIPTTGGGGGSGTGGIITDTSTSTGSGRERNKRSAFRNLNLHIDRNTKLEIMASAVLRSIDEMVHKNECLKKSLCDGNRQAQLIGSGFQYLMPAYSFGASFIGEKFGWHDELIEQFDSIVLGIEESNCKSHFPSC